jgi:hypothetical protein
MAKDNTPSLVCPDKLMVNSSAEILKEKSERSRKNLA